MGDCSEFFGQENFDKNSAEPLGDFKLLPAGQYLVTIDTSEVRATKAKNGHLIYLEMKILEGEFKGQKIFDRINIDNPSEDAVAMGKRTLRALTDAANINGFNDTSQLIDKTVVAHVKVDGEYNDVRTYSNPSAVATPVTQGGPVTAATAAAPDTTAAPWQK